MVGRDVVVGGGGDSAGQAAIHLARFARSVTLAIRRESLSEAMSDYLIGEIRFTRRISVAACTEVVDGGGDGRLEWLAMRDNAGGSPRHVRIDVGRTSSCRRES